MKKHNTLLVSALLLLTSCASVTRMSTASSDQRYVDGIYYRPAVSGTVVSTVPSPEFEGLVAQTKNVTNKGKLDTLIIPENKAASYRFDDQLFGKSNVYVSLGLAVPLFITDFYYDYWRWGWPYNRWYYWDRWAWDSWWSPWGPGWSRRYWAWDPWWGPWDPWYPGWYGPGWHGRGWYGPGWHGYLRNVSFGRLRESHYGRGVARNVGSMGLVSSRAGSSRSIGLGAGSGSGTSFSRGGSATVRSSNRISSASRTTGGSSVISGTREQASDRTGNSSTTVVRSVAPSHTRSVTSSSRQRAAEPSGVTRPASGSASTRSSSSSSSSVSRNTSGSGAARVGGVSRSSSANSSYSRSSGSSSSSSYSRSAGSYSGGSGRSYGGGGGFSGGSVSRSSGGGGRGR